MLITGLNIMQNVTNGDLLSKGLIAAGIQLYFSRFHNHFYKIYNFKDKY